MCSYLYLFTGSLFLFKPPIDDYLRDFQGFAITNNATMKNLLICYFICMEVILQGRLLGLRF